MYKIHFCHGQCYFFATSVEGSLYHIGILLQGSFLDKAPRLSISIVICILSSDTICQLNQFNTNSEAAMLSIRRLPAEFQ